MNIPTQIKMTFDEFVGPYKFVGGVYPALHPGKAMRWLPATVDPQAILEGGYAIHRVLYSVHPTAHERELKACGPAVIAKIHGVTIGGVREHYVWVHHDHARLKLHPDVHIAAEMGIEWFLMARETGVDWRLTPESRAKHGSDKLTKPGLEFRKMQYVLMVKRGILDPGDSLIPEKR